MKHLKCGYTTGTCAAAAAGAAAQMLCTGKWPETFTVMTPKGVPVTVKILENHTGNGFARCAVRKYSGDDPDITNGVLVYADVTLNTSANIVIDGGKGIGRVTHPGLWQKVGEAAINEVPRQMIYSAVSGIFARYGEKAGASVIISIPAGVELAEKTFNPRLGIKGGISVLGTSGIVEPMSDKAFVDTIRAELRYRKENNFNYIISVPGNSGADFVKEKFHINSDFAVKCGNFVGETIDCCAELSFKGLLLAGHVGKFVKLAAGIMNTHSRNADGRMEILTAHAAVCGADTVTLQRLMDCITTNEALDILNEKKLMGTVMERVTNRAGFYLNKRAGRELPVGAVLFSDKYGMLGMTGQAPALLDFIDQEADRN